MNRNITILNKLYKSLVDGTITAKNKELFNKTFENEWNRIHNEINVLLTYTLQSAKPGQAHIPASPCPADTLSHNTPNSRHPGAIDSEVRK